jgi:hypothetical protein
MVMVALLFFPDGNFQGDDNSAGTVSTEGMFTGADPKGFPDFRVPHDPLSIDSG